MAFARIMRLMRRELDGWRLAGLGWAAVLLLPFLFIFRPGLRSRTSNGCRFAHIF